MDKLPDLRPIVIPALQHKMKGNLFTCVGNGLQKDGHTFDNRIESYLPLLKPVLTKAGKPRAHQPQIKKQPLSYWKAQCVFRNLPQTGTVARLQERLRSSDAGMDAGLKELEEKLNLEFRVKNASVSDEKWNIMETPEAKAEADPKRFIFEHFSLGQGKPIVLKTNHRSKLHQESENLDLAHESVDAPRNPDGGRPEVDRWIVIGKDESAVREKVREISREATRARHRAEELKAERTRKLHQGLVCTSNISGKTKTWDVTGSWTISCPYMEEQWGEGDSGSSLTIAVMVSGRHKQISAQFDFIAITGIFRFISPILSDRRTGKPQSSKSVGSTRVEVARKGLKGNAADEIDAEEEEEDRDDDEESIEEDEYDEIRESPTPEEFYMSISDHPSPKYPTWNYRWRGEETGEGEIQLYSDKKLCSVTFGEPGGTKLVGTFDSDLTGRIDFTGMKTGASSRRFDPDSEWHSRSEQEYESARVGRWH
ncbi:hypothetical protein MMC15_002998 [Xylographa vitiligo]|nr:hypothetical protein [Xylographa vitiligo]